MDDHHPQYGIPELRQLMKSGGRTTTTASPSTSSHFPSDFFGFNLATAAAPPPQHHRLHQFTTDQEMGFLPRGVHGLGGNSSNLNASTSGGGGGFSGFLDGGGSFGGGGGGGDGGGTGRWPRQETLTLLEIRSRLDHKFKEANQKGPLWDEVSRFASLILSFFDFTLISLFPRYQTNSCHKSLIRRIMSPNFKLLNQEKN